MPNFRNFLVNILTQWAVWIKKFLNSILIQISYSAFDEELGCSGNGGEGWVMGAFDSNFESSVLSLTRLVLSFEERNIF